jgi:hypothetical protein
MKLFDRLIVGQIDRFPFHAEVQGFARVMHDHAPAHDGSSAHTGRDHRAVLAFLDLAGEQLSLDGALLASSVLGMLATDTPEERLAATDRWIAATAAVALRDAHENATAIAR